MIKSVHQYVLDTATSVANVSRQQQFDVAALHRRWLSTNYHCKYFIQLVDTNTMSVRPDANFIPKQDVGPVSGWAKVSPIELASLIVMAENLTSENFHLFVSSS